MSIAICGLRIEVRNYCHYDVGHKDYKRLAVLGIVLRHAMLLQRVLLMDKSRTGLDSATTCTGTECSVYKLCCVLSFC